MKIIIGLGNPGEKYNNTRHNVGFEILDLLSEELGVNWTVDKKRKILVAKNNEYLLLKPQSFMNLSGEPVRSILDYYKILPKNYKLFLSKNSDLSEKLVIVHDDLDIDFGLYKTSIDSRSAGHNGVQSIINHLKTKNFKRVRIGIRNESLSNIPREKFVLQRFNNSEKETLKTVYPKIIEELQK